MKDAFANQLENTLLDEQDMQNDKNYLEFKEILNDMSSPVDKDRMDSDLLYNFNQDDKLRNNINRANEIIKEELDKFDDQ